MLLVILGFAIEVQDVLVLIGSKFRLWFLSCGYHFSSLRVADLYSSHKDPDPGFFKKGSQVHWFTVSSFAIYMIV
jgi:hypothetical protein